MRKRKLALSFLVLSGCISSNEVTGYGWEDIKGVWDIQGIYTLRGDTHCLDNSDPYYHSSFASSGSPTPYCRINFQPATYSIDYPEFKVFLNNEELDGVIRYDTHSTDSGYFNVKFSKYLIDPILGKRFIKDTTQLYELGTLINDSSPNDTLHLFDGSDQKVLKVLVRG